MLFDVVSVVIIAVLTNYVGSVRSKGSDAYLAYFIEARDHTKTPFFKEEIKDLIDEEQEATWLSANSSLGFDNLFAQLEE